MVRHLFSTAVLMLGVLSANAQAVTSESTPKEQALQKTTLMKPEMLKAETGRTVFTSKNAAPSKRRIVAAATNPVEALYQVPEGGFWQGVSSEGWLRSPIYYTAALQDQTWKNYSSGAENLTYVWQIDTLSRTKSTAEDYVHQVFGFTHMPTLTASDGTNSNSYIYQGVDSQTGAATTAYWSGGTDSITSIGNADPAHGIYGGFKSGIGFRANTKFLGTQHKVVGFVSFYDAPTDTVQVSNVYMVTYQGQDGTTLASVMGDKKLTANIDYFDDTDKGWHRFATATASASDAYSVSGNFDYTTFTFMSEDPILGEQPTPIVLPKRPLRVSITGFNQFATTDSTTVLFSSSAPFAGNGYVLLDNDSLASVNYSNAAVPQVNLHIGFNAAIPVLELATDDAANFKVTFPTAGGLGITATENGETYNDVDIYTMSNPDNISVDVPDWISATQWNSQYFDHGILLLYFQADALPAGTAGRSGIATVNCFGKELKIKLVQGTTTGINGVTDNTVKTATNSNVYYNVAGQRVAPSTKGLLIHSGKKYVNK